LVFYIYEIIFVNVINSKRFGKAASISGGIFIGLIANKWFEQAWNQPNDFTKWTMIFLLC